MPRCSRRRGSALILVLLMTLAIAALSIAAIFLSSSSNLLAASIDRERTFRLAALAAIEMARDSVQRYALVDNIPSASGTPMQLISGGRVRGADGTEVAGVSVNVYAAMTGDTTGGILPTVTLVAQAYDAYGVRHVQRADLRPESFSDFAMFVDGDVSHGPGVVGGRAHANGNWTITAPGSQLDNVFLDTLSATGTITDGGTGNKAATFVRGSRAGFLQIDYPRDSSYAWMATLAASAGLSVDLTVKNTALPGSATAGGSRVEFVTFDANANGTIDANEGFFVVVDFVQGMRRRMAAEPTNTNTNPNTAIASPTFDALDPVIQHQCGAFYRRQVGATSTYRWHFLPVSSHARTGFSTLLQQSGTGAYPAVTTAMYGTMSSVKTAADRIAATELILTLPTARCFPAGSPYLMPSERFTKNNDPSQNSGASDNTPWGTATAAPSGGWYGGSDTTFTAVLKTCDVSIGNGAKEGDNCSPTSPTVIRALRARGGTGGTTLSHSAMNDFFWRLASPYNASTTNRGLVNIRVPAKDTAYVSGVIRGRLTVRVDADSGVILPDRLRYAQDPNDPALTACANVVGLITRGDILVASGLPARLYEVGTGGQRFTVRGGGEERFTIHGYLMSLRGAVGVGGDSLDFGPTGTQISCPEDEVTLRDDSNGGCFAITGGIIMDRYRSFFREVSGKSKNPNNTNLRTRNGMRYSGTWDRCSESGGRPPYFPVTTRVFVVRSLEVGVSRANTPSRVATYLRSLLGKPL